MTQKTDDLSIFNQLGMTTRQAQVYVAINEIEQAKVLSIAKAVQCDRAEIYRVVPKLQEMGLVKKIFTTPVTYRALPLSEGLSILLQRNTEKHNKIQAKVEQFLESYESKDTARNEDFQYTLTVGLKAVARELIRHLKETKTNRDGILEWNIILYLVNTYFKEYKKTLEKGVKIRSITHLPKSKEIPQIIKDLMKTGGFEIRNTETVLKAGIDIHDKKDLVIVTARNSNPKDMEALCSNNPEVAKLAQDYFELKWQSTAPLDKVRGKTDNNTN